MKEQEREKYSGGVRSLWSKHLSDRGRGSGEACVASSRSAVASRDWVSKSKKKKTKAAAWGG